MTLKTFARMAAVSAMLVTAALAGQVRGADAAERQGTFRTVSKEVAMAMMQEQQAAELAAKGKFAEAEALYKEALAVFEKSMPGDPELATSLNNFGQFYRSQRRFSEAEDVFNRALTIYVANYGDNHTLTATVINNLANSYLADHKYDAAEPLFRRGLAASEKLLGSDNGSIAISLDWLAQTHFFLKRPADAESELKRALAIAEKATGPDSRLVVGLLDHMIAIVKAQGREQDAAALKARAEVIIAKSRKQ
jgi:tetratricopeptide (TPR) repeat protein